MLIRSRPVKILICLVLCIAIIFGQIAVPFAQQTLTLTIPASAIAGVDDAVILTFILSTMILTFGYNLITDFAGTTALVNQFLEDCGEVLEAPLAHVFAMFQAAWDGHSPYVDIGLRYGDYEMIMTAFSDWFGKHVSEDGKSILLKPSSGSNSAVEAANYMLETYPISPNVKNSERTRFLEAVQSNSSQYSHYHINVLYQAQSGYYHFYVYFYNGNFPSDFDSLNDDCFYLRGFSHVRVYLGGYVTRFEVKSGNFISFRSDINPNSGVDAGYWYANYDLPALFVNYGTSLNLPKMEVSSGAGSISIPVEKDEDYTNGAVITGWDAVIGRVGADAETLPFRIPMTEGGLGSMTVPEIIPDVIQREIDASIDVPDTGEVDTNMPKVDDLKLPSLIITKFPFCIPFDLQKGLSIFLAAPIEPRFEIPIKVGGVIDTSITLDFRDFDFLIRLIRWFELALFTVGLAAATRKFIKW